MNRPSVVLALALAALTTTTVLGQTSAVTDAIMSQRSGKLDVARTAIDKAVVNEKTSISAKAWYTRGLIYEEMISHPLFGKTAPANAAQVAYESYQKAVQLDEKGKDYAPQAKEKMKNLYGAAFNAGVMAFNGANAEIEAMKKSLNDKDDAGAKTHQEAANKKFDEAIQAYTLASSISPQDTSVTLYSAYAYEGKKNVAGAEKAYRAALAVPLSTRTKKDVYARLIQLSADKPEATQLAVAREAVAAFPNDKDFLLQEISLMLRMKQEKEAIDKVQAAIKLDPKNSNLYAVLGTLYDKTGKPDMAVQVYEQAITADPTNFDAQFNLGVYQFNRGAELTQKLRNMAPAEYAKPVSKKMQVDSKTYFTKSVPYFEAALKIKDKECDASTLASLGKAYAALNRNDDATRIGKVADDCAAANKAKKGAK